MRYLKPLSLKQDYFTDIEATINSFFEDVILKPIIKILQQNDFKLNSKDIIADAINSGKLVYQDGVLVGQFNAKLSKEIRARGGKFNKWHKGFVITQPELGADTTIAIAQSEMRFQKMSDDIIKTLDNIDIDETLKQFDLFEETGKTIDKMNADFKEIARGISIPPELTEAQKKIIAEQWTNNLELYIKDFTQTNILELRGRVQKNVTAGKRSSSLVKIIQDENKTTKAKAKFLARQETSLLTSKMREQRFTSLGVTKYQWRGAMDDRERPDHKALQGKIFSWDEPPVVDKKKGRRANPGEDFGCRCLAIPILED